MRRGAWISYLAAMLALGGPAMAAGLEYYVAPAGNDAWSGRLPAPNAERTDGPFATLERARDAVPSARRGDRASDTGATVNLRTGTYCLTRTFSLEAQDGAIDAGAPVVYCAYRNEDVRIQGGQAVKRWQPVRSEAILRRLDLAARGKVLEADLRAQGITDFGRLRSRGFGRAVTPAALELFFQDRPMTLARWPNGDSWAAIVNAPKGADGGVFTYAGDRPARWTGDDIWVHGYWTFDWADTYEKVASIDAGTKQIATLPPHGQYGYSPGRRFYALNILEELDTPGEYYLDRKTGMLYFWPPGPVEEGRPVVALLETPLIAIQNAAHIVLRGLTLEASRGSAVEITGSRDCLVAGCRIRNLGTDGINISGGARCGVQSCDIQEVGDSGVHLSGGDRKTLAPGGHFVVNCEIHHMARWDRTYRPAIGIDGVGCRAAHNLIHDGPHNAILMGGNDHIVEYNDISRVCTQTGDAGAVYMGRDLAQRGTIVRYNHFHDIGPTIRANQAGRYTEVMAVYLDDCYCGVTILGNLFERAGRSIMLGGGRDNSIENNVFVDCNPAIHVDQRGKSWAAKYFQPKSEWMILEHLQDVPFDRPPYSTRYPHLANILSDDPPAAKYNRIVRNIRAGSGKWIDWLDGLSEKTVETHDNWTEGDPGFVSPAAHDYRLRPDAPALKSGFVPLPLSKIGLYRDEYRRTVPAR